jgi:mRNA-degrading endonuclease RelE of RelBE toxin-antitoxin system
MATNEHGDVIRLQGIEPPRYRLRVGEVRVLIAFESETRTLRILRVLPRGRAYLD